MPSPKFSISLPLPPTAGNRIIFSDVNYETFAIDDDEITYNIRAIGQSLMTILSTYPAQRLFHPNFGSNLEMYLFEPVDDINAFNIKNEIVQAITTWEHRVKVSNKSIKVVAVLDEERYWVEIKYAIPDLEDTGSISFNLAKGSKK